MNEESKKPVTEELYEAAKTTADTYNRYQSVKQLAQHINGLSASAPFPDHVAITSVEINYTVNGIENTAVLQNITRVGDVADLLAREAEFQVDTLRSMAAFAQNLATQISAACELAQYNARAQQVGGPQ